MGVSTRFVLEQGPVLRALAVSALRAARSGAKPAGGPPSTPGPEFRAELPPRSSALIDAYVRHVGGDAATYRTTVPPHLFPQWTFGIASETLRGVPYPLTRILNGGSRLEMIAPIPRGEPLHVRARLESIDDNGSRAVLRQRVITGTRSVETALIADLYAIVPLKKREKRAGTTREHVPELAREIAFVRIAANAGLDFAKLTGDFNPIHWVPAAARAAGFQNVILHGFSTLARSYEAVVRGVYAGAPHRLRVFDVRFTKPLVLPSSVGFYVEGDRVLAGSGPLGAVYLDGTFEAKGNVDE
ncbi:MAG: MaoC/PaaZ C-terminal domain-containing protein [Polyangiales bacterium]|nr:MaoC family dehydratase N-terminal domain-containing protein [Myxococcales bacterium]